jgi:DNA-binding beta-propeller fold protein YncE
MDAHTVSIVDVASGRTLATHPVGQGPHEVTVSPDGRTAIVAIYGNRNAVGSSLTVFDLTKPAAAPRSIELGVGNQRPHGLAFLPNGADLLVTGERTQRLLRVQVATGAIDSSMTTGQATSHMVAATPDGARAYTANITGMSVSAIDVPTKTLAGTWKIGARVEAIAVLPNGHEVWAGGNDSHLVYALDTKTGAVAHTLTGFGMAYRIGFTPDGATAVISDPGTEKIHLVDVATHTIRTTIDVPAALPTYGSNPSPQGVWVARDGAFAYVTLKAAAQVAVVDIATGTIVKTLPVGAGSDGVAWSPLVVR